MHPSLTALVSRVEARVPAMQDRAAALDAEAAFPVDDIAALREAGVLLAPIPTAQGGLGMGTDPAAAGATFALFRILGQGNLALGRLIEAHVNAIRLIVRYGDGALVRRAARDADEGHLFGLWVTDPPDGGLSIAGGMLDGRKQFCSGAGYATRAVLTAADPNGDIRLVYAATGTGFSATRLPASLAGMRAATTGQVRYDNAPGEIFGAPGDYLREPDFSCGAWRTSAVTLGGIAALTAELIGQLKARGRHTDPHQQARIGEALIAAETARLWMERAAAQAESADAGEADVAYVGLARLAVERAALEVIERVQRGLGIAAVTRGNPAERIARDLVTYLRQPAGDMVLTDAAAQVMRG